MKICQWSQNLSFRFLFFRGLWLVESQFRSVTKWLRHNLELLRVARRARGTIWHVGYAHWFLYNWIAHPKAKMKPFRYSKFVTAVAATRLPVNRNHGNIRGNNGHFNGHRSTSGSFEKIKLKNKQLFYCKLHAGERCTNWHTRNGCTELLK